MKNNQRGVALSGLIFWGIVIALVSVMGMKILPSVIEYYKILKDVKATAGKVPPEASVTDVRKTFDRFAEIDTLSFSSKDLDISKDNGRVIIDFAYEKRIPLFWNVSVVIDYKGSSAE